MDILEALNARDEGFIAQRMIENIAFFSSINKDIEKAFQSALYGKNTRYKLHFGSDINILFENKPLFPKDSFIDFAINIAQNPLNNELWKLYGNNLKPRKITNPKLHITKKCINEMLNLQDSNNYYLPSGFLPQTNIFGLCGGVFLQILLDLDYFFHSLLVYEIDLELFALSGFFVNYFQLFSHTSQKSCYIFIENLANKAFLNHYFYHQKITNNFLKLEIMPLKSKKCEDFRLLCHETYRMNSRGWGSFEDEMIGFKNTLKNLQTNKIIIPKKRANCQICVVGSGPSLENNLDFLAKNQDKMLIFSCGTASSILQKHKIHIDFHIEIERTDYLSDILKSQNLGNAKLLCASVVDNSVLALSKNSFIFLRGGSAASYIVKNVLPLEFCAPFVGNAGFSLACNLSDEIIICGLDCGYIEGKSKHSSGSFYGDESTQIPNDCFEVSPNADKKVFSNAIFSLSKEALAQAILFYKPKSVYNIGSGAFIANSKKIKAENLILTKIIDKNAIFAESCEILNIEKIDFPKEALQNFINNLKAKLSVKISTKTELFERVDEISRFLAQSSKNEPEISIFFEGSVSHLLQNMLMILLTNPTNDIESSADSALKLISNALDSMQDELLALFKM